MTGASLKEPQGRDPSPGTISSQQIRGGPRGQGPRLSLLCLPTGPGPPLLPAAPPHFLRRTEAEHTVFLHRRVALGGSGWASLSSQGPNTDLKDYNRQLPSPALQTPRDADFQELEHVHLLCHFVQSQLTRPPASPPRPGLRPSVPLVASNAPRCSGNCFMFVCHAEKAGTDRCGHRDGGFALSFPPTLSSCVQSEGFYWAPSLPPLTLWPCSPAAVSRQPPRVSPRSPACPHACAALARPPSPRKFGGGRGGGGCGGAGCRRVPPGLSRPPPGKHTSFALLPVHMLDKETDPH